MMISHGATDIGKKRKVNQDYLFFSDERVGCFPNLYIVADGMGGHKAGDKASSFAVLRFIELAKNQEEEMPFLVMKRLLRQVNEELFMLAQKEEYLGMGTTLVMATVVDHKAYIMNIGDSRLYVSEESTNSIRQVTLDHSLVEELVRAGQLDPSESRNHPQKNIITKAVGVMEQVDPDFFVLELKEGQRMLLCSDGLSNMVDDEKLGELLTKKESLSDITKECIEEALFFGGLDNIAVVITEYQDGR